MDTVFSDKSDMIDDGQDEREWAMAIKLRTRYLAYLLAEKREEMYVFSN